MALGCVIIACAYSQGWPCYGGNPSHTGIYEGTSQTAAVIKWNVPLDGEPNYYGGVIYAHFAAPMITPANNIVHGYRYTTGTAANPDYDNWEAIGRSGLTGAQAWTLPTDYSAAVVFPNDWTSVFPMTLFQTSKATTVREVAVAGAGGSVIVRASADLAKSTTKRYVFYTTLADFMTNEASYAPIKINTPITADTSGNLYFGYVVTGSIPSSVSALGSGGIVKLNAKTGIASYVPASSIPISGLSNPAMNCAPALTADGTSMYVGFDGSSDWLLKMSTKTLATTASVEILDPAATTPTGDSFINESSASPMVAPDGHVYMGVFAYNWRESHGWMLQFDANLNQKDAAGTQYPVGAFGWDDTACVVDSKLVPSYSGAASYLILTKYNNYLMGGDAGADGSNKVAVLDPTSNSISRDRQSGIPVMNEIITVLGPTHNDSSVPAAVCEWCINSAAVDVKRQSAIVNSEDGHMYRWNFITNTLDEAVNLEPPTSEAYTMTSISPSGQIYALNNCQLFAVGSNNAYALSVQHGKSAKGGLSDILYHDGANYTLQSVSTTDGNIASAEMDYKLTTKNPTVLNVVTYVNAPAGVTGTIYAYNFTTKSFDPLGTQAMTGSEGVFSASTSTNVTDYIGKNGEIRVVVEGLSSTTGTAGKFTLALDFATAGLISGTPTTN